jgi:hypothetical protein
LLATVPTRCAVVKVDSYFSHPVVVKASYLFSPVVFSEAYSYRSHQV